MIGWLYQFYISEKKGAVFAGLKKNKKITPENIPAATQLFTPHWIVRYLVENSCQSISVAFNEAWLADESDVERYLSAMRKALLEQIQKGNRIQI